MARLGRKKVRPGRVTTAVSLGTLGLFVISMSAGLSSWSLGLAGAAMLVICVALLATASMRGAEKAFVAGTVHVVKVTEPPLSSQFGRCEMQVLVDAPGHPGQTVIIRDPRVPVSKWPDVGGTLPALVSVSDVRRVKIQWDRVGTHGQVFHEVEYKNPSPPQYYDDEAAYFGIDPEHYADPANPADNPAPAAMNDHIDDPLDEHLDLDLDVYADYRDDDPMPEPTPGSTAESEQLPRRPRPYPQDEPRRRDEPAPVTVLEGELLLADVPSPRTPLEQQADKGLIIDDLAADLSLIDFSDLAEPVVEPVGVSGPSPIRHAAPANEGVDELLTMAPAARPASVGAINGVGITILVTDLDRSVGFYRDMLGFYEIDGGMGNVVLASGDTRVVLRKAEVAPVNRRLVHLNLEVEDVDAVYRELKVRGTRFTYAPRVVNQGERLELWAAAFRDPDGHGIAITQWKANTSA